MPDRVGTAQWEDQANVAQRYPFEEGKFWLGRAEDGTPIGYRDDRHICLVSGTRGGKGTSFIINNLCLWPGSAIVVDPKGENATVTAARRGQGSGTVPKLNTADGSGTDRYPTYFNWTDQGDGTDYPLLQGGASGTSGGSGTLKGPGCAGMGQAVYVLDPFGAAQVEEHYRSHFNPLDVLDPNRDESIDEASRLANAIVVVKDDAREPFWDESARAMVRGLILYVLTAPHFSKDERNLVTVRNLILRGEWQIADTIRAQGHAAETIDPPHLLLWRNMERISAFEGLVAGIGRRFRDMMKSADRTYEGVLQSVTLHTEFIDSPGMRKVLAKSDFKLSELKTRPEGMTLYLSLPQRYMDTHYRWLRMMVALTTTEMEITRGQPATGYPILMVLDEFAGLKRMTAMESAVSQIAGYGVKLFFVLQSLEQLKHTYKDNWETFLSNAGLKIFCSVEDHFTREYVSKLVGQTEVIREMQSSNQNTSEGEGFSKGHSDSETLTQSTTRGDSVSRTTGRNESTGWSQGQNFGLSYQRWKFLFLEGTKNATHSEGHNTGSSGSRGSNDSNTVGKSFSETGGRSETTGINETYSRNSSSSTGTGRSETLHLRPLVQPDEMGRAFARIDDKKHPAYPGLALVTITGADPLVVWRRNYFEDVQFIGCFSPHPDHKFLPVSRPSAPFPTAYFHKLFDDYWHDRTPLAEARALFKAALDKAEAEQRTFFDSIQNPQWRSEAEAGCSYSMDVINSVFSVALWEKTGNGINPFLPRDPLNLFHENCTKNGMKNEFHHHIDIAGNGSQLAYYNSRGICLVHIPNFSHLEFNKKVRELIPDYGWPSMLPNNFGWATPFLPGRYPTVPPPQPEVLPYKKKFTPEQNRKFIRQMIVYALLFIAAMAFLIWVVPLLPSGPSGH
jgi:type IV secretory pathway TraG/TraD family ATPase VirD4